MNRLRCDLVRVTTTLMRQPHQQYRSKRPNHLHTYHFSTVGAENAVKDESSLDSVDGNIVSEAALSDFELLPKDCNEVPSSAVTKEKEATNGRKLNLVLAASQLFSRREAESLIQQRRVTVAGQIISRPQQLINDYDCNLIEIDGVPLRAKYNSAWPRLWAVQKLKEEIMSDRDPNKSRSVFFDRLHNSLLPTAFQKYGALKPIYRLGYQVEGLVMVTNSGEMARLLSNHPTSPVPLTYKVRVHGVVNEGKLQALEKGIYIDDKRFFASQIKRLPPYDKTNSWLEISVVNYQKEARGLETMLKKMFLQPSRIISIGFGPFRAENIFNPSAAEKFQSKKVTIRQVMAADNNIGVNAFVKEVKLPPTLHAIVMRHMNSRHVVQPYHLVTAPRPVK